MSKLLKANRVNLLFDKCVSLQDKRTLVGLQEVFVVYEFVPVMLSSFIWINWLEKRDAD